MFVYALHVVADIMEEGIRRAAPDEARIRAREATLVEQEIAYVQRQGWRTIPCPCAIHCRETRSALVFRSYRRCLREHRRHPWFFGRSEVSLPILFESPGCQVTRFSFLPKSPISVTIVYFNSPSRLDRVTIPTTPTTSGTLISRGTMAHRLLNASLVQYGETWTPAWL